MPTRVSTRTIIGAVGVVAALAFLIVGLAWDRQRSVSPATDSGSATDPAAAATRSPARGPRTLTVIGDSYSQGTGTDGRTWWEHVADQHGFKAKGDPVGGTGYCAGGDRAFRSQVAKALAEPSAVIVVAGSRNDVNCASETKSAATEVLAQLKDGAREARVVVVGPMWDSTEPSAAARQADAGTRQAAQELGLTYVDALEASWLGGRSDLIDADGVHPVPAGVDVLARGIDSELTKANVFS